MKVKYQSTKELYPTMCEWWDGQNFPHVSPSILPEGTFVCYNDNDEATHSMCFYNTDSFLCWTGFPVSNPSLSKEDKAGCFTFLLEGMEKYAKEQGYHVMFTTTQHEVVRHTLEKLGYMKGDEGVDHYTKTIL